MRVVRIVLLTAAIVAGTTSASAEEVRSYKCWARGKLRTESGREHKFDFATRIDATSEGAAVQQARKYFQSAYFQGVRIVNVDITCRIGGEH